MLDEGMSRPRRPIFTPQTFISVVGIKGNEFVLKNAFVGVSNDLYVFVVVTKEGFPRSDEGFPGSEEGFPLEVSTRPSDVSLREQSRRLLILGSTRDD